jgi:hypothetical protein
MDFLGKAIRGNPKTRASCKVKKAIVAAEDCSPKRKSKALLGKIPSGFVAKLTYVHNENGHCLSGKWNKN